VRLDHKEVLKIKNIVPVVLYSRLSILSLNHNDLSTERGSIEEINAKAKSFDAVKANSPSLESSGIILLPMNVVILCALTRFSFGIVFLYILLSTSRQRTSIYGL